MNRDILRRIKSVKRNIRTADRSLRATSKTDRICNPEPKSPRAGQVWICTNDGEVVWLAWNGQSWVNYEGGQQVIIEDGEDSPKENS